MYNLYFVQLYDEAKDTLIKEREERMSLVEKMSKLENQLKDKGKTIGELTSSAQDTCIHFHV